MKMEEFDKEMLKVIVDVENHDDCLMDVEMLVSGAHSVIAHLKEEVRDLSDLSANLNNQLEAVHVKDITWCWSRISKLKKPNNPANCSLWQLVNHLIRQVDLLEEEVLSLKTGTVRTGERLGVLEMSSTMIQLGVHVLEEAMEIDPPLTDLTSEDSDYQDIDDGGVMLVEDLEDERDQENEVPLPIPPPIIHLTTPHPPVLWELIPIDNPAPLVPGVDVKGEDNAWYIPPIHCCWIHALDKYSTSQVEPVPEYVEEMAEDPVAGLLGMTLWLMNQRMSCGQTLE